MTDFRHVGKLLLMDSAENINFYGTVAEVDNANDINGDITDSTGKNSDDGLNVAGKDIRKESAVPFRKRKFRESFASSDSPKDDDGEGKQKRAGNIAANIMAKMGHTEGRGLGKEQQGRAEPVQLEMRLGRRGLGAKKTGLEPSFDVSWDISDEQISVEETVIWAPDCPLLPLCEDDSTEGWITVDSRIDAIDNETEFVDETVLKDMLQAKSVFDELDDRDLRNARSRANPFESIKGAFFQNRAAMKMANLDAILDFQLTNTSIVKDTESGTRPASEEPEPLFYFADVCAGPGGFTEYVLWKRNWAAKILSPSNWCPYSAHGFGFTLRGKDDFKLQNMLAASPEMFEPHYGDPGPNGGKNGDGDVTKPENLDAFAKFVARATGGRGVQLFIADGGFSVEGQENIQEILSKRLYLCQILCAFKILAPGGNLICKLFDVFTPFSAGLLYLMWRCFDKISLHKPNTSRPANSERYVIAMGFRDDCAYVTELLWEANLEYDKLSKSRETNSKKFDVASLVPLEVIRNSPEFCQYLTSSNNEIARRQTFYLNKYRAFAQNRMLTDHRQSDIREKCLEYWGVPDVARPEISGRPMAVGNKLAQLCNGDTAWISDNATVGVVCSQQTNHVPTFIDSINPFEYRCAVLATKNPGVVCALGGSQAYIFDGHKWDRIIEFSLHLPKDTIVYGELTNEFAGETKSASRVPVLRIFDAYFLNGKDISNLPCRYRQKEITKFCCAISHEFSRGDLTVARAAESTGPENLYKVLHNRLSSVIYRNDEKIACKYANNSSLIHLHGLLFYRIVREPWTIWWSKRNSKTYWFNTKTGATCFQGQAECVADFRLTHSRRRIFTLSPNVRSVNSLADGENGSSSISPYLDSFLNVLKCVDSKISAKIAAQGHHEHQKNQHPIAQQYQET